MTITLKRLFTAAIALGMLGVGSAFAQRTDYNTVPYAESFENLIPWGGSYTNVNISNGWYSSSSDDQSVITNLSYTFTGCSFSLTNATHTNVLKLNTEGATLTNSFGSGFSMSNSITYIDTMVQFVASEDKPASCTSGDSGIKVGVYADVNTNLVVYHGVIDSYSHWSYNTTDVTTIHLDATNWYRLTIVFDATAVVDLFDPVEMFQVKINGVTVQNPHAYDDGWKAIWQTGTPPGDTPSLSSTGTWFRSASGVSFYNKMLTGVGFQGTGYIDDLVVTTNAPSYTIGALSSFLLTIVTGAGGSTIGHASPFDQVSVNAGDSTTLVFTADQWYQLASLTTNAVTVAGAAGQTNYSLALNNIQGDISNNVSFVRPIRTITVDSLINGAADPAGPIFVLNGESTSVLFTAADWYRVDTVSPNGTPGGKTATATFTTVQADTNAGATFITNYTGAIVAQVPSSWGLALGVTEDWATAHTLIMQQSYMLNLNTTNMNPTLTIDSIGVNGTTLSVGVLLENNGSPTNTTINGTLWVYSTTNLTVGFTGDYKYSITGDSFTNSGTHMVTFTDADSNKFYKAGITLP